MSKHAKNSKKYTSLIVSLAVGASSLAGYAAFASTVQVDANGLSFNSGALAGSAAVTQDDGDSSNDLGENFEVGDEFHYYNVFSSGGTQVDARITMVRESGIADDGVDGRLHELDDASSRTGANKYLQTEIEFDEQTGNSFADLKIEFLTGLTTTAGSGTSVTLSNLKLTIMDVDHYQYVQLSGVDSYTFAQNSILTAQPIGSGVTRFVELNGTGTSSSDPDYEISRVTMSLGELSQLEVRLGQDVLSGSESEAFFDLDFSSGGGWSVAEETLPAPTPTPTPEVTSDVERAPATYTGPIPKLLDSCVSETGGVATLSGQRLAKVTSAEVESNQITILNKTDTELRMEFPSMEPGTYDVEYGYASSGKLTHLSSLKVCEQRVEPKQNFYVYERFSNYRGDRGAVVASDRQAIEEFIESNPGLTRVTCVGSTSGVPALSTDPALAKARAANACSVVEELVPGVTTREAFVTGRGMGQFHRAVIIYGVGNR